MKSAQAGAGLLYSIQETRVDEMVGNRAPYHSLKILCFGEISYI